VGGDVDSHYDIDRYIGRDRRLADGDMSGSCCCAIGAVGGGGDYKTSRTIPRDVLSHVSDGGYRSGASGGAVNVFSCHVDGDADERGNLYVSHTGDIRGTDRGGGGESRVENEVLGDPAGCPPLCTHTSLPCGGGSF
jgi:hypothetical protein